jgi:hypothetical protein
LEGDVSKLPNGDYRTEAGSTLRVSGKYSGIFEVGFDWVEEEACCDCYANAEPQDYGSAGLPDWRLVWHCDYCDGGAAKLERAGAEE